MNVTASNLACVQHGDLWSALQTGVAVGGLVGAWTNLAENTDIAGITNVQMWLKGVEVTGTVTVADPDDTVNFPELKGVSGGFHVGLIQIINKAPIMQARYENFKYTKWMQRSIPFFDSTGIGASPWYNTGSRTVLVPGLHTEVKLQDYPTTKVAVVKGADRLLELQKALDFDVYLAVAPITAAYKQNRIRILWQMQWSTNTHLEFSWNGAGAMRYKIKKFVRTATAPATVDEATSKTIVQTFPMSAEGANEAISSMDLV